ncbi:glutathione S-transferase N-terminal domain-containing protein [Pelagibacteraceae bacterium]|nr:glutathione S-transferase N-terminal domain-containing protein [Candidatus Pelagibacter bacterium]MDC1254007.1 glutathione S-transferase N-terminal domain-containing protein [Pelagibacteraceae bacterium]
MTNKLILFNGPNSPFGRKTKITSMVQEIVLEEKIIKVQEASFLDKHNPLRKIPTLLINDLAIIDSDNICVYLDSISNKKTLFPKNEYFKIISMVSVANGLMESVLERRMEIIRPTNEQSNSFINKQEIRIARTIKWLEENWKNYNDNYLTMDQIAIACSLEYTNFRLDNQWEKDSPKLIKWLKNFRQKDFMKSTVPLEAK